MSKKIDRNAILQTAAKSLAWKLFVAAGHSRVRWRISVERFDRELRSALRQWRATTRNLNPRKEPLQ